MLFNTSNRIEVESIAELIDARRHAMGSVESISVPLTGNLREMERDIIRQVIERNSGDQAAAARVLGMHRRTLDRLLDTDATMLDARVSGQGQTTN